MNPNTNFSYKMQYSADSSRSYAQRTEVMDSLQGLVQQLLAAQDSQAKVVVSGNHRSGSTKLVEMTTCLGDAQLASMLQGFSEQHGVRVTAFE